MISRAAVNTQLQHRNIEDLKGRNDPAALQAAARELEALFAYEMIKAMRATTETTKGGFGKDAYMSLFDTELSRIIADRGLGLKEVLLRRLNQQAAKAQGSGVTGAEAAQGAGVKGQDSKAGMQQSAFSDQPAGIRQQITGALPLAPGPLPNVSGHQPYTPDAKSPAPDFSEPTIPVDGVISSKFGMRKHPLYGENRFHYGMDIAAPEGTEIYPYLRGKVIFSGEQSGYGNTVVIDHGNGYTSKYAHNRINLVKVNDLVDEDTIIAEVGSTGLSTGPHLHFEVKRDGKHLDPARVLALK